MEVKVYEKSGSGIPVGLSHENIQRIWITSFLSAFYVFPLLKSPTGGRRMIRKMKLTDLDKVMDIWLFSNIQAHDFIPEEYWRSNWQQVRSMLPESYPLAAISILSEKRRPKPPKK